MTTEQSKFINEVAVYVQKYAPKYGIKVCSPIIAQAILESGWGKSSLAYKYHNYFGLKCGSNWKGKSVNMTTKEEYKVGQITTIKDNFRAYDSMEEGIKGYFDFINYNRYSNLKGVTDYNKYIELIKADGYATSSKYIASLKQVVENYGLTKFDKVSANTETNKATVQKGDDSKVDKKLLVKAIQSFLNTSGFNCGTVDGIVGDKTINAMTQFLKSLK